MAWLNLFSQIHWPFSGAVTQDIHPSLLARAGDPQAELRVLHDVASYGRQIGVLSDLLLAVVEGLRPELSRDGAHALAQLQRIVEDIRRVKDQERPLPASPEDAQALLQALQDRFPELKSR